jgi:hypothetical protein
MKHHLTAYHVGSSEEAASEAVLRVTDQSFLFCFVLSCHCLNWDCRAVSQITFSLKQMNGTPDARTISKPHLFAWGIRQM